VMAKELKSVSEVEEGEMTAKKEETMPKPTRELMLMTIDRLLEGKIVARRVVDAIRALIEKSDQPKEPQEPTEKAGWETILDNVLWVGEQIKKMGDQSLANVVYGVIDDIKSLLHGTANSGLSRQRRVTREEIADFLRRMPIYDTEARKSYTYTWFKEHGIEVVDEVTKKWIDDWISTWAYTFETQGVSGDLARAWIPKMLEELGIEYD